MGISNIAKYYHNTPGNTTQVTVGLFYDSKTKEKHWSFYVPHKLPPSMTLCGRSDVNFSSTGIETPSKDNHCSKCQSLLEKTRSSFSILT